MPETPTMRTFHRKSQRFITKITSQRLYSNWDKQCYNTKYHWSTKPNWFITYQKVNKTWKHPSSSQRHNPLVNHKDVKQAINKHWHLIQQNPQLLEIFPKQPFVAFRKTREKLIRAKLTNTDPNKSTKIITPNPRDSVLLSFLKEQIT